MQVSIKRFDVAMEVKTSGIELDVSSPQGVHLGDLMVTKTTLTWCRGRTRPANGKHVTWDDFMAYMESLP